VRLKLTWGSFQSPEFQKAKSTLLGLLGVRRVQESPVARSVLVLYDPQHTNLETVAATVHRTGVEIAMPDPHREVEPTGDTALARWISASFAAMDEGLFKQTGGALDLRTLFPVGLGVLALREILSGRIAVTPWYALAWYAYSSFRDLREKASPD
jgi:hypothetical protein